MLAMVSDLEKMNNTWPLPYYSLEDRWEDNYNVYVIIKLYVEDNVLGTVCVLPYFLPNHLGRYYYPHITNKETEAEEEWFTKRY